MKVLVLDVQYASDKAYVAGGLFSTWETEVFEHVYHTTYHDIAEYEPGSFFKRELPCLMHLLELVDVPLDYILIDGYCYLSQDRRGLGAYLFDALEQQTPVIGIAKKSFHNHASCLPLHRGESSKPLFVTAAGMDLQAAFEFLGKMHGPFRIPTLLKAIDSEVREMQRVDLGKG